MKSHEFEITFYGRPGLRARSWSRFGNPHEELCSADDLRIFRKVGKKLKIPIKTKLREGGEYVTFGTANDIDDNGSGESTTIHRNIVPKGKVQIEITNDIPKMGTFYAMVDALARKKGLLEK